MSVARLHAPWPPQLRTRRSGPTRVVVTRRSPLGHPFAVEPIAQPAQGHQIPGPLRLGLDLFSQIRHLVVDDTVGDVRVRAPDLLEQLCARENPASPLDER